MSRRALIFFIFSFNLQAIVHNDVRNRFDELKKQAHAYKVQLRKQTNKENLVKRLLHGTPFTQGYTYLITWYEWRELAISDYIRLFNRTHTTFGLWGLEQLTKPIIHLDIIKRRQQGISQLDQDKMLMYSFCKVLDEIKQLEDSLLTYYKETDQLSNQAQQLYYSYFQSFLNKSKIALDYSYLIDVTTAGRSLATLLCLNGLMYEFLQAQSEKRSMHIIDGLKRGFTQVIHDHQLNDQQYQQLKAKGLHLDRHLDKHIASALDAISSLDIDDKSGWITKKWAAFVHLVKSISQGFQNFFTDPALFQILTRGTFGDKWSFFKEQCHYPSLIAFFWTAGGIAFQDHCLWLRIKQNYERLTFLYNTHINLQHRLCDIAQLFGKVQELLKLAETIHGLKDHKAIENLKNFFDPELTMPKIKTLLQQLKSSTFATKKKLFYSRGQVLITHALLREIKDDLLPVLQTIGVIDGFISIGRIYHEYKDHRERPFSFVQFKDTSQSHIQMVDGWLPLIPQGHVPNSFALGCDNQPRNLLLTGPNGGGKSSLLKLIGGTAVLAQSWGIIPARACTMSVFDGLRTSLNPQEDIKKDISTFMAQKERLDKLKKYAQQGGLSSSYMLLVDEPYRGTIEAEAEKRAYQFGQEIGNSPCMLIMASHLKKPIDLQYDTKQFVNKQFQIKAHQDGTFTRTFKLLDGPAWWWFQNIEKRMRFIDWLHTEHSEAA